MSAEDEEERSFVQMVTAPYRSRANDEMSLIGLLYAAGLFLVVLPLLPFLVIIWALSTIRDAMVPEPGA